MLFWKFKMGLFENPYVDPLEAERSVGSDAHRQLALQSARETITLLKNENHLLPLNPNKLKTVAVIGPNADRELLGGYSGKPNYFNSVLEGIRAQGWRQGESSLRRRLQNHRWRLMEPGFGDTFESGG